MSDPLLCPDCGSENIEENDPRPGEHTCRDCGGWIDDDESIRRAVAGSATPTCPVCDEPLTDGLICLGEKHDVAPRQLAGSATPSEDDDGWSDPDDGTFVIDWSKAKITHGEERRPDADVHFEDCHSTECPCYRAGLAAQPQPDEVERLRNCVKWAAEMLPCTEHERELLRAAAAGSATPTRHECVAKGCDDDALTEFTDGAGRILWLCEDHGDELAMGFPLKDGVEIRVVEASAFAVSGSATPSGDDDA